MKKKDYMQKTSFPDARSSIFLRSGKRRNYEMGKHTNQLVQLALHHSLMVIPYEQS